MTASASNRRPSLRDVARHAGVSHTMVSLILNGKHPGSAETRCRVMEAVEALGYQPDAQFRKAITERIHGTGERAKTRVLAFLVPQWIHQEAGHRDGYYSRIMAGIMKEVEAQGYEILISPRESVAGGVPACIREDRVDGVLIDGSFPLDWLSLIANRLPTVYINRYHPGMNAIFVTAHWPQSVQAMVQYAWDKGHRNFSFFGRTIAGSHVLGTHHHFFEALRFVGGQLIHPELSRMRSAAEGTAEMVDRFIDEWESSSPRPTVVLTDDNQGALLARRLDERGFKVPDDLSIIGRLGHISAQLSNPPLTSYEYPVEEIVERAVRLLVQSIESNRLEPSHVMIEGRLVERASVKELSPENRMPA